MKLSGNDQRCTRAEERVHGAGQVGGSSPTRNIISCEARRWLYCNVVRVSRQHADGQINVVCVCVCARATVCVCAYTRERECVCVCVSSNDVPMYLAMRQSTHCLEITPPQQSSILVSQQQAFCIELSDSSCMQWGVSTDAKKNTSPQKRGYGAVS